MNWCVRVWLDQFDVMPFWTHADWDLWDTETKIGAWKDGHLKEHICDAALRPDIFVHGNPIVDTFMGFEMQTR